MTPRTKTALVIVALVALWYGFGLMLPKVADGHGEPALTLMVCSNLKWLASANLEYGQVAAKISAMHWEAGRNAYRPLLEGGDRAWRLTAIPRQSQVYTEPLGKRLLFLDFHKHTYPVFQIRSGDPEVRAIESSQAP